MYTEASGQKRGDQAWLFSPVLEPAPNGACVTFWYHMYGQGEMPAAGQLPCTCIMCSNNFLSFPPDGLLIYKKNLSVITFPYCMFTDIGTLRLFTALASGSIEVWNRTGNAGNYWVYAAVNVTTTAQWELSFDALIGKCQIPCCIVSKCNLSHII